MPIGVFARATRLSVRALRNYDRLGLLVPVSVDPDTGYRRYSVDQLFQAGLIRRLRELEAPLPEIAEILAADPEHARAVIETAYRWLGRWIAEQDRTLAGPAEESYLVPPGPGVPASALRTEIAWPVRRPAAAPRTAQED